MAVMSKNKTLKKWQCVCGTCGPCVTEVEHVLGSMGAARRERLMRYHLAVDAEMRAACDEEPVELNSREVPSPRSSTK